MHILLTNDDGPPSAKASPYFLPFFHALEEQGHTVSVIIPNSQRSWIGKAHIVGQDIRTTRYYPPATTPDEHSDSAAEARGEGEGEGGVYPWILVDSTPATCVQIGIAHFFQDRGAIDLVISGPNYGRNTTAVFALSSGTLGAALEACICGYRAIAISFAFFDKQKGDAELVGECVRHATRVSEWLARNARWGDARLYSVNVPVRRGVGERRTVWTRMLLNAWKKGMCYAEIEGEGGVGAPEAEEARLRRQESSGGGAEEAVEQRGNGRGKEKENGVRYFKWAPKFGDVFDSVQKAGPGSDGWTVQAGETSVTALQANFQQTSGLEGEINLAEDWHGNSNI